MSRNFGLLKERIVCQKLSVFLFGNPYVFHKICFAGMTGNQHTLPYAYSRFIKERCSRSASRMAADQFIFGSDCRFSFIPFGHSRGYRLRYPCLSANLFDVFVEQLLTKFGCFTLIPQKYLLNLWG